MSSFQKAKPVLAAAFYKVLIPACALFGAAVAAIYPSHYAAFCGGL